MYQLVKMETALIIGIVVMILIGVAITLLYAYRCEVGLNKDDCGKCRLFGTVWDCPKSPSPGSPGSTGSPSPSPSPGGSPSPSPPPGGSPSPSPPPGGSPSPSPSPGGSPGSPGSTSPSTPRWPPDNVLTGLAATVLPKTDPFPSSYRPAGTNYISNYAARNLDLALSDPNNRGKTISLKTLSKDPSCFIDDTRAIAISQDGLWWATSYRPGEKYTTQGDDTPGPGTMFSLEGDQSLGNGTSVSTCAALGLTAI